GLAGEALLDAAYQRVKLLLDLAGSALAFAGAHAPSYAERPAAFARLCPAVPALAAVLPASFASDLAQAARAKTAPAAADLAAPSAAHVRRALVATVPALAAVLRWELQALLGVEAPLPALLEGWLRRPGLRRRAWEWARVALHPLPAPLPLSPLRGARLFWRSTPRGLLDAAGALAYLGLAGERPAPGAVARLLPLRRRALPCTPPDERRAVVALWRWCVRNG
ncbi:MAG TPA: hypothetical protein VFX28_16365, partial [Methylomirabilota bacterium]|nr:hypothetical protein [Methylomirabilota bacterium]